MSLTMLIVLSLLAPPPAARREALLAPGRTLAQLAAALADRDPLVARTAVRCLIDRGPTAARYHPKIVAHPDALVRANAAVGLAGWGAEGIAPLEQLLGDAEPAVRTQAVTAMGRIRPLTAAILERLDELTRDESQEVRSAASLATASAYQTLQGLPLPTDGWRFAKDTDDVGRDREWFATGFDDTGWDPIGIGVAWQHFGYEYTGVGWYRRTFDLPARDPAVQRAILAFDAVDEEAWVWINGQYAGDHVAGPEGWDKPFSLDVTPLLRWDGPNQITVRVYNSAFAGGIWLPVTLRLLAPAE